MAQVGMCPLRKKNRKKLKAQSKIGNWKKKEGKIRKKRKKSILTIL